MRSIAIDTNAYSVFKRGDEQVLEVLRQAPRVLISITVLGELLGGFAFGAKEGPNRAELTAFLASPRVQVVPLTSATADIYASLYAALRRLGKPIPTNDLWIAASAMEHGAALLSLDQHFAPIVGLRVGRSVERLLL